MHGGGQLAVSTACGMFVYLRSQMTRFLSARFLVDLETTILVL